MHKDDPTIPTDAKALLEREAQEWLVRLTSGHATIADAEALRRWCDRSRLHAEAFAEANLLWESVGSAAVRAPQEHVLAHAVPYRAVVSRRTLLAGAGSAAVAIGFLALRPPFDLWPSAYEFGADYRTRTGERRQIALESGVSIDLNTRTSLNMWRETGDERLELVSGEAAVATAGKLAVPLTIAAAGGRVRVTDAYFNLRCDSKRAVVTCERGSVAIEYSGNATTLRAAQQISYGDGALDLATAVDPAVVMAWRQGQLVFRQTPLSQVIGEVNRYRSGRIVLMNEALGRRLVEARIPLDRIDDLIILVREAYGAQVTALPGGVMILT